MDPEAETSKVLLEIDVDDEYMAHESDLSYHSEFEYIQNAINDSDWEDYEEIVELDVGALQAPESVLEVRGDMSVILANYSEKQFQENFRMPRKAFDKLVSLIEPQLRKRPTGPEQNIEIEHQLLATIWLLATSESYRAVSARFNIQRTSLTRSVFRIITAVKNLSSSIISWPNAEERQQNKMKFKEIAGLPNVIGIIDATYVHIKPPKLQARAYTNRKKYCAITLQAICDPSLKFIDCSVGHPSSMHDARIFQKSRIFRLIETSKSEYCPNNSVILADQAYTINAWCITPFRDYGQLDENEEKFNKAHAATRQVVERCFALFYGRWRRLHYLDMDNLERMPNAIMACCVIHNICLMFDDDLTEAYISEGTERVKNSRTITYEHGHPSRPDGVLIRKRMEDILCGSFHSKTWLKKNIDVALSRSKDLDGLKEEVSKLQKSLAERLMIKEFRYECGWNYEHYRGCLKTLERLANMHGVHLDVLKGRVVVFAPFTGVSLEGHVMLFTGDVLNNWLDFIKNIAKHDSFLEKIPRYEKALSQVLRNIKIGRRKFMPKQQAVDYAGYLTKVTTTLLDFLTMHKYPKSWPQDLGDYEIVIESESGPLMVNPTGQLIAPSTCPGTILVDFITNNLEEAKLKADQYKTNKYIEQELLDRCVQKLNLKSVTKDESVTPDKMIQTLDRLLMTESEHLTNIHLNITNYYSVLSDGTICIPWDFTAE